MQRNYFKVLFVTRMSKQLKNGEVPISMRITMGGKRSETLIKRSVNPANWDTARERAIGCDRMSNELNRYLDEIRATIFLIYRELEQYEEPITADTLKRCYCGKENAKTIMLREAFRKQNQKVRELLNVDYVLGTVLRYERTERYLGEYINSKYGQDDIAIKKVNNEFICDFEHFLKVDKECAQNTAVKYMKNLKTLTRYALANKWITSDPFFGIKFRQTHSNREFLTEEELNRVINKEFSIERMSIVRDIFVFCALTGLAFTDAKHLRSEHVTKDVAGNYWIKKPREKTNNMCSIPLLDVARNILERYKDCPYCNSNGILLPVPTNQRMNAYLKEIADLCEINKTLTTHIARHTFACVAIANKVSLESIAKMLGHNDLRTTRIYAKLMDETVAEEMSVLKQKFSLK